MTRMTRGSWLDKVRHQFTVLAVAALFVLLVYLTWKMLRL
jgi:hypothetical protein